MLKFTAKAYLLISTVVFLVLTASLLQIQRKSPTVQIHGEKLDSFTNVKSVLQPRPSTLGPKSPNKVVIASVICSKDGDTTARQRAAIMIKSIIISHKLYKSSWLESDTAWVEFHAFLEHNDDDDWILGKLIEYGYPFDDLLIDFHFHSASDAIPEEYQKVSDLMLRCMYIRHVLATELKDVDSVLYADNDMIFVGNVLNLWGYLREMTGEQLIGVVGDYHKTDTMFSQFFKDIPVPPPKGLNAGLLLMNLTKMRETRWEERMKRVYKDYSPHIDNMNDQQLVNILLYFDPGALLQLPCQFNFWTMSCFFGHFCPEAEEDPNGIQVVHGAAAGFNKGEPFWEIFSQYKDLDLGKEDMDFKRELMVPIREAYRNITATTIMEKINKAMKKRKIDHRRCDGVLNRLMFKSFFLNEINF